MPRAVHLLIRAWELSRTRFRWGWRFHSLGGRSVLGRHRLASCAPAATIGHHTTLCDGWSLVDLDPSHQAGQVKIRIGSYCTILHDFQCNARVSVELQDYVLVAPRVFITDSDHVVDAGGQRTTLCRDFRSAPVVVEHDCWLGVNAVILKGVRIGHHTIVGANAVVTRDVPPGSTVVGIPARQAGHPQSSSEESGRDARCNHIPS
jgi:acetyltransferase-like isoleucine patch superfamily enzyme